MQAVGALRYDSTFVQLGLNTLGDAMSFGAENFELMTFADAK